MKFQRELEDKKRTFEKRLDTTRRPRGGLDSSFDSSIGNTSGVGSGSGRESVGGNDSFLGESDELPVRSPSPILAQKSVKYLFWGHVTHTHYSAL